MANDVACFAIPAHLAVEQLLPEEGGVTILAAAGDAAAPCPLCGEQSDRIHSRYVRTLADLPWSGVPLCLRVTIRKFFCGNAACPRRIFAERLDGVARAHARRTDRQRATLETVGFALGGEAGARLAARLGVPASPDTVLRCVRGAAEEACEPVRVLGIDDWSWRRGHRFGTILVDLERHRVVDLLRDREVDAVVAWLQAHPGVEIISRDRGDTYIEAATKGAPAARQVADRWHLLKNLADYLERFLLHHTRCLKEAAPILEGRTAVEQPPAQRPAPQQRQAEEASVRRHAPSLAAWEEVRRLHAAGADIADIARTVGVSRTTAYRYLRLRDPPERKRPPPRATLLDPYKPHPLRRWEEGCHNKRKLFREIRAQGYRYSEANVFRFFAQRRRGEAGAAAPTTGPPQPTTRAPSAHHVATLLVRRPEELTEKQAQYLAKLGELSADIATAYELVQGFGTMLRERQGARLDGWTGQVEQAGIVELRKFAGSLKADGAAVKAGLTLEWSQGQVEGQVNRLKLLKRQSYGRAGFTLLRKRALHAA